MGDGPAMRAYLVLTQATKPARRPWPLDRLKNYLIPDVDMWLGSCLLGWTCGLYHMRDGTAATMLMNVDENDARGTVRGRIMGQSIG
jgi:hypothetical protein